jgi:hypothetical protein
MDQYANHPLYRRHTLDSAINSLWEFYKKNFAALFGISLIMALVSQYISATINIGELQQITDPQELLLKMRDFIWPVIIISVISLFFSTILHYHVLFNPINSGNNVLRSSLKSLQYFMPYLITMILFTFFGSIALFLGFVALIIGALFAAIYLVTIYFFILPVMLAEGPSIANTIGRTFLLVHRKFWHNVGWTSVFILLMLVISIVLSGIILLPFTGSFIKVFKSPTEAASLADLSRNPFYIILNAVVSALIYPAMPIFAFILYFNGRAMEEVQNEESYKEGDGSNEQNVRIEDLYSKPLPENEDDGSQNT